MTTETKMDERCPTCSMLFRSATWLPWRKAGYCRRQCVPEARLVELGIVEPPKPPAQASLL